MDKQDNPYAAPETDISSQSAVDEMSEVEQIRHQYLRHEAAVRSIGWLYYLLAALPASGALAGLAFTFSEGPGSLVFVAIFGSVAAMFAGLGTGLRRLSPWVRTPVMLLSIAGMTGFPIGTIICGWILSLVATKKGEFVFSAEYREIIRQTPHMQCKITLISVFGMILLALIVLGALLSILRFAMTQVTGG